jgi:hypothetical protein
LTGFAVQAAKVIDDDGGSQWIASPDLLHRLNGALCGAEGVASRPKQLGH